MASKADPKTLSTAANLANLLPTGTVLAFQTLVPSFSNNGTCLEAHKYLTFCTIVFCSFACFFSSFTDSFVGDNGKLYYGIATINRLHIFNKREDDDSDGDDDNKVDHMEVNDEEVGKEGKKTNHNYFRGVDLTKYKIGPIDFVHAVASLLVFLVFATSNSDVQNCFFPKAGPESTVLMINLPLGVGALSSFLFMIFPTKRRGIGYADKDRRPSPKPKQEQGTSPTATTT